MPKIKRAVVSVSNKKGLAEFAKSLHSLGVEILSTGGTAKSLRDAGIPVKDVSDYTGFPEMLDGRLKTLHPKVHGGLLSRRDNPKDMEDIKEYGIELIDMVVVNLYPFEETVTMLRSASKNFKDVAAVTDYNDYGGIIKEMKELKGDISYRTRLELAKKVFRLTSKYDSAIADYLKKAEEENK
ncbi:MAG: IMP cyclohydrolase [Nitrospirae bacterium]|nr:IMP cyclohydrolase [Nitrospirota bacterium]